MARLAQLHKHKQHTHSQRITHTSRENTRSICALGAWVHSNNPMVNVLLSGSQRGSLTMCTFRTQSLTAAKSLWRKAWNVSRRQMQAALKGISITSRQAGPYVMVTSLRDAFPDLCPVPCQHAPSWKYTGPRRAPLHCWKHVVRMCRSDNRDCLLQEWSHDCFSEILRAFLCDAFDDNEQK